MRLRHFLIAALLSACTDGTAPLAPGASTPSVPDGASLTGTSAITAVPGFSFAPPVAQRPPVRAGAFDGALAPSVVICELGGAGTCTQTVATLTTAGTGDERVRVNVLDELYEVSWSTRGLAADGKTYRVRVLLWAMEIGSVDVRLVATGAEVDGTYYSSYGVDDYPGQTAPRRDAPSPTQLEVPEVRSASGGSGRWTPRRGA